MKFPTAPIIFADEPANINTSEALTWDNVMKRIFVGEGTPVDILGETQALNLVSRRDMNAVGTDVQGSANEFNTFINGIGGVTNSQAAYEKVGLLIIMRQDDPTEGVAYRGMVGIDTRAYIGSTNPAGQAWGGISSAQAQPGGDGFLISYEVEIVNSGAFQPMIDHPNSKYNLHLTNIGDNKATAALVMTGKLVGAPGAPAWHDGIVVRHFVNEGVTIIGGAIGLRISTDSPIIQMDESSGGKFRMQVGGDVLSFFKNTATAGDFSTFLELGKFQDATMDCSTSLALVRNINGVKTVQPVVQGAPNSGGPGLRALCVIN